MRQCPHCGASVPERAELCPACGEELTPETGSPAEEAAVDLFAEASRQETERRAAYRAKKRLAEQRTGSSGRVEEAPAADLFSEASKQETERRRAAAAAAEIPADRVIAADEPDGAAQKKLSPAVRTVLRIAAIAAAGGLLIWWAKDFSQKIDPEPVSSETPHDNGTVPEVREAPQPVCYFRGNQPYYSPDGETEIELGKPLSYSWNDANMSVDAAQKYALSSLQSFFAAHTRRTVQGNRIFFPTPYRTDAESWEEGGYLLNCIDLNQNGIVLEDLTGGEPVFGDYWLADESGEAVAYQTRTYFGTKGLFIRYMQDDIYSVSDDVRDVWTPQTPDGTVYFWCGDDPDSSSPEMSRGLYSVDTRGGYNSVMLLQSGVTQLKRPAENPELIYYVADELLHYVTAQDTAESCITSFNALLSRRDKSSFFLLAGWENGIPADFESKVYPDGSCYYTQFENGKKEWAFFDAETMEPRQLPIDAEKWDLTFAAEYPMILLSRAGDDPEGELKYMLVNRSVLCNITALDYFDPDGTGDAPIKDIFFTDGEPGLKAEIADDAHDTLFPRCLQGNVPTAPQNGQDNISGPDILLFNSLNTQNIMDGVLSTRDVPATLITEPDSPGLVSITVLGNRIARRVQLSSIRYDRVHNCLICISDYADNTALGTLTLIFFSGTGGTRVDLRRRVSQLTVPQRDSESTFSQYIFYISEEDDGKTVWTYNLDTLREQNITSGADYFILTGPAMLDYSGVLNTRASRAAST